MKKTVRLTESDLTRIIKRVIQENNYRAKFGDTDYWIDQDGYHYFYDKDRLKNITIISQLHLFYQDTNSKNHHS